jgi:hypothetical protein
VVDDHRHDVLLGEREDVAVAVPRIWFSVPLLVVVQATDGADTGDPGGQDGLAKSKSRPWKQLSTVQAFLTEPSRQVSSCTRGSAWLGPLPLWVVCCGRRSFDRSTEPPLLVALVRIGQSWRAIRRARRGRAPAADWPEFGAALANLTRDEGWRSLAVGEEGAALRLRRATDDDRPGIYAVRYRPCDA